MKKIRIELGAGTHLAIGLMSGTSHDGVSAALVRIREKRGLMRVRLLAFRTFPYANGFRKRLLKASTGEALGAGEISALNFGIGRAFGYAALNLARGAGVAMDRIAFVGSHGHTLFHLPPGRAARGEIASTLQMGEAAVIAALTGVPVVADFRPMDMALGGEAAPLAPLAHLRLLGHRTRGRVVQNIGGIGNATWLPPGAQAANVIAFDTGPGNGLIDALASKLSHGRLRMDRNGALAARGTVSEKLLAELMRHPYFARRPPKSTGREEFGSAFLARVERRARTLKVRGKDLIATVTALTARSIGDACRRYIMPLGALDELIVSGGGTRNPVLISMLKAELPGVRVIGARQAAGVDGDALEALAFAILAHEMLRGRPGNIPSVTGARSAAVLGKLTLPPD